jgi:DTW domain-containing protein YfiP
MEKLIDPCTVCAMKSSPGKCSIAGTCRSLQRYKAVMKVQEHSKRKPNTERLSASVLANIRGYVGDEKGDGSKDAEINQMSDSELFEAWCTYEGFLGYAGRILTVHDNIFDVKK